MANDYLIRSIEHKKRQDAAKKREIKRQNEKFLMFTRFLIKVLLEQKDNNKRMHDQANTIIKDCAERNERQEPGYREHTTSAA